MPVLHFQCWSILNGSPCFYRAGAGPGSIGDTGLERIVVRHSIMQDHFQKGFVHTDTAVVFKKAELAKSVHEEADTGSRGANHFRQCLLRNFGINVSGSPGSPNSAISRRILAKRFSLELKS